MNIFAAVCTCRPCNPALQNRIHGRGVFAMFTCSPYRAPTARLSSAVPKATPKQAKIPGAIDQSWLQRRDRRLICDRPQKLRAWNYSLFDRKRGKYLRFCEGVPAGPRAERAMLLSGLPVSVDNGKAQNGVAHYFLSHMHTDHLRGLKDGWSAGTLFCTDVFFFKQKTAYEIEKERVQVLSVGHAHLISLGEVGEGCPLSVTLIDANHCPGAVMFLFQGSFGAVLHTGDFRFHPSMVDEDSPLVLPSSM